MINALWIWVAIGLMLLAVEIAIGTVYILWFGIAALCVAVLTWLFPQMPPALQFVVFALLSAAALAIWKIFYKKTETHSRVGQAQGEEIGRTGTVIEPVSTNHNGKISFAQGLMGSREWVAVANEVIEVGSQAKVVSVEGNALRVTKIE